MADNRVANTNYHEALGCVDTSVDIYVICTGFITSTLSYDSRQHPD